MEQSSAIVLKKTEQKRIKELESHFNEINPDIDVITEQIDKAKSKLETINEQNINGFLLQANAIHVENIEKN